MCLCSVRRKRKSDDASSLAVSSGFAAGGSRRAVQREWELVGMEFSVLEIIRIETFDKYGVSGGYTDLVLNESWDCVETG